MTILVDPLRWFAVQVLPQHEQKVASQLQYKGYEKFLPLYESRRQWSDRKKVLLQPLFPGYVFCRTTRSRFTSVLGTPGVVRIVSFGAHPCPIPDEEMDQLQHVTVSGRSLMPVPYVKVGQKVQIASGPLSGISGVVMMLKNKNHLVISVDLIMKAFSVDISTSDVIIADARKGSAALVYSYET